MSKNVIWAAIAAAVLLVGVLVGVQMLGGDDATKPDGVDEVTKLLDGIPQRGAVLGDPKAPVTVVEYIDFKCPVCAAASQGAVPAVIEKYVRSGKVKMELRPVAFIGPDSERGALAALAAGMQDKMWNFSKLMLQNQGNESSEWITDEVVKAHAKAVGVDEALFAKDYAGDVVVTDFTAIRRDAQKDLAPTAADPQPGTPRWVVSGPGGRKVFSGAPVEPLMDAIEAVSTK